MGAALDRAKAEAAKQAKGVAVREDGGKLVYAAGGTDLMARDPATPDRYTVLRDFPKWGYKASEVRHLGSAPGEDDADLQAACTARDLAAALPAAALPAAPAPAPAATSAKA